MAKNENEQEFLLHDKKFMQQKHIQERETKTKRTPIKEREKKIFKLSQK